MNEPTEQKIDSTREVPVTLEARQALYKACLASAELGTMPDGIEPIHLGHEGYRTLKMIAEGTKLDSGL